MRDNRGISLVELLVSIAASAVLLSGLVWLIFYTMQAYNKNSVSVELQNEASTALALVTDCIMSAEGVTLRYDEAAGQTDSLLTGSLIREEQTDGTMRCYYSGRAVIMADKSLYLISFPNQYEDSVSGKDYKTVAKTENGRDYVLLQAESEEEAVEEIRDYLSITDSSGKNKHKKECLMAENVSRFFVREKGSSLDGTEHTFKHPLTLDIKIEFTKEYTEDTTKRSVEDSVTVRNKLKNIWINNTVYTRKLKNTES